MGVAQLWELRATLQAGIFTLLFRYFQFWFLQGELYNPLRMRDCKLMNKRNSLFRNSNNPH